MPVYLNEIDGAKDYIDRKVKKEGVFIDPYHLSEWIYGQTSNQSMEETNPEILELLDEVRKIFKDVEITEIITILATSIFDRGLTHGSTGNISVRLDDNNILVTPSGSSFGRLDPNQIVKVTKSGEIIDLGVEMNIIQKAGSWFSYNENKLAQGRDSAKQIIEDNPELMKELESKIKEKINN